jgi:hypothetical protein
MESVAEFVMRKKAPREGLGSLRGKRGLLSRARGKAGVRSDHAPACVFTFLTHLQGLFCPMNCAIIVEEIIDRYSEKFG